MFFGGSLRRNLDPFTRFPDAHLWKALEGVHLKDKVDKLPGKLYADMLEFGNSFDLGERQLLCLSRALMKSSKIILFEECSSVVTKRYLSSYSFSDSFSIMDMNTGIPLYGLPLRHIILLLIILAHIVSHVYNILLTQVYFYCQHNSDAMVF